MVSPEAQRGPVEQESEDQGGQNSKSPSIHLVPFAVAGESLTFGDHFLFFQICLSLGLYFVLTFVE